MWATILAASERKQRLFVLILGVLFGGIGVAVFNHEVSVAAVFGGLGLLLLCAGVFLSRDWLKRVLETIIALAISGVIAGSLFSAHRSDILSGKVYFRAIVGPVLLVFALFANRLLKSDSVSLRAIGRLFWSTVVGCLWTVLLGIVFVFARTHTLGTNSSEAIPWLKWVAGATFLALVWLFYWLFLLQERKADENLVYDESGIAMSVPFDQDSIDASIR